MTGDCRFIATLAVCLVVLFTLPAVHAPLGEPMRGSAVAVSNVVQADLAGRSLVPESLAADRDVEDSVGDEPALGRSLRAMAARGLWCGAVGRAGSFVVPACRLSDARAPPVLV